MSDDEPSKTVIIGNNEYTITVLQGNHGGWLFVKVNGNTIFEQAGYKGNEEAYLQGEVYARAYEKDATFTYGKKK